MKKVSVTDKYTYDGKEMTEREREIYKHTNIPWYILAFTLILAFFVGIYIGNDICKLNH